MNSPSASIDHLNFVLPNFTRIAWVSDEARDVWEPRLTRISAAWSWIEWLAIVAGIRACAVTRLSSEAYVSAAATWAKEGLSSLCLDDSTRDNVPKVSLAATPKQRTPITVVVGMRSSIHRFKQAWSANESEEIGALLGHPSCCRKFLADTRNEYKVFDPTWAAAAHTLELTTQDKSLEVRGSPFANVLWRWMGVRPVVHFPCRFDCCETIALGEQYRTLGIQAGVQQEMKWLESVLSWPVQWSALHGIAEVKTPILRVSTRTEATAEKYVVRWIGDAYPNEGARGVTFPYATPQFLSLTRSKGYQEGLKNINRTDQTRPDWYYRDNGFSSLRSMEVHHTPLVILAREQLRNVGGMILDLGCGNGALLQRICVGHNDLVPCGVDTNSLALEHGRQLMPAAAANFVRSDLFQRGIWSDDRHYALAILSVRRLLEVKQSLAETLLADIRLHCDRLLVYTYSNSNADTLRALARKAKLRLADGSDGIAAMVSLTESTVSSAQHSREMSRAAPIALPSVKDNEPVGHIDWDRMAKPQPDGYDTKVVLRLRAKTLGDRNVEHERLARANGAAQLFDGRVTVVNRPLGGLAGSQYLPAPSDHPNLAKAVKYLNVWPEVAFQFPQLVHIIQPWIDISRTPKEWLVTPGSSSHSLEEEFGIIMVTVDNAIALATAMVHEMAHHKLRALGVSLLTAKRLITNDPEELYFSPIKGRKRPITAVLHAQYSFIHVTNMECALLTSSRLSSGQKQRAIPRFADHVSKMEEGQRVLHRYARTDADGALFLDAFFAWSRDVLARAKYILATGDIDI